MTVNAKTNYLEDELLDHALGVGSWTSPTNVWLALFESGSWDLEAGTGTEVTEGTYIRQQITFGTPASGGSIANTAPITFPAAGAAGWNTITNFGIFDQEASGGNMLYGGDLNDARTILEDDVISFATGELTVQEL